MSRLLLRKRCQAFKQEKEFVFYVEKAFNFCVSRLEYAHVQHY